MLGLQGLLSHLLTLRARVILLASGHLSALPPVGEVSRAQQGVDSGACHPWQAATQNVDIVRTESRDRRRSTEGRQQQKRGLVKRADRGRSVVSAIFRLFSPLAACLIFSFIPG